MKDVSRTGKDSDPHWDAAVIGAGPSGAMAAREMARLGARVLLVERRDFPREKVCGGCLNGHAIAVLHSAGLGTLAEGAGGSPLQSFRMGVRRRSVQLELPAGCVVARARFDAALVDAAVDAGARFLPRTEARVGPSEGSARRVHLGRAGGDQIIRASVVLAATGLGGTCLPPGSAPRTLVARGSRVGIGCVLADGHAGYDAGVIHMAVGKAGYVGLVRLHDGCAHIAGAIRPDAIRQAGPGGAASSILAEAGFPPIEGLDAARWQGTPGLTRCTRPLSDVRLFVLGDAAGYVEPFTGEGIAWALASGRAIATLALRAAERWEPRLAGEWEAVHHRVVRRRQTACRLAAMVLRRPWLAGAARDVMALLPGPALRFLDLLNAPPRFVEAS